MAKKDEQPKIPNWSIHVKKGIPYYRIQTYDADGRRFDIYGRSEQEVKQKYLQAQQEIEDAKFRKLNPTVREYSEKWLEMHSALIRPSTLKGYTLAVHKYIINPLGDMYVETPYLAVRRAWHSDHNRPVVTRDLKTPAAKRDVPIPQSLVDCLREAKEKSNSKYVIADKNGEPLSYSQFNRIWNYIRVRGTHERTLYKYVNGQAIQKKFKPEPGQKCVNRENIVYCLDFKVTPHQLRHTYITNLIHAGVDPKTVQYLAGHENSQVTMDIYAKAKYNRPEELSEVVNGALKLQTDSDES